MRTRDRIIFLASAVTALALTGCTFSVEASEASGGVDFGSDMEEMHGWDLNEKFPVEDSGSELETTMMALYNGGYEDAGLESLQEYQIEMLIERGYEDPKAALKVGVQICDVMHQGTRGDFANYLSDAYSEYEETGSTDKVSAINDAPVVACPDMLDELQDGLEDIEVAVDAHRAQQTQVEE